MKTNAIIRIIAWSLVIVILLGVLFVFTLGKGILSVNRLLSDNPPAETAIPRPLEESSALGTGQEVQATVIANAVNVRSEASSDSAVLGVVALNDTVFIREGKEVNGQKWLLLSSPVTGWMKADFVDTVEDVVFYRAEGFGAASDANTDTSARIAAVSQETGIYSAPNKDSEPVTLLPAGEQVTVTRQEAANGIDWVYITEPQAGWVMTEHLTLQEQTSDKAQLLYVSSNPNKISELDIDWVSGTIRIQSADVEDIRISETEVSDVKYAMHLKEKGSKLSIEFYADDDILDFGIGIHENITKDLTILVPYGWHCNALEIDAAAADLNVTGLVIDEVEFDGASGKCTFDNCVVDELDVDTASGDIVFIGELNALDCDGASATVEAILDNIPSRIDMDSMSGNLALTLPASTGFTLKMDSMGGDFISNFGFKETSSGTYTCGDGACRIDFSSMSGMVVINKADPAADAVPESSTTP